MTDNFSNLKLYSQVLPSRIRVDIGTETGVMATMHSYQRELQGDLEDPTHSVLYRPSTQNKIERWWRELLERMELFFKRQLASFLEDGNYDPTDDNDRLVHINMKYPYYLFTIKINNYKPQPPPPHPQILF